MRSAVTSVVVHASGAVCTRLARLELALGDGAVTVRVPGLPPTLVEHSLRGRVVSGPPGLRVTDLRLDFGAVLRRAEQLPSLRLDVEDAEDRESRLRDRRDRLATEIEEVAGFRAEPPQPRRGDPPRWAPVESILTLAGFVESRLSLLHQRLRTAEDELAAAVHDLDVRRHRLDQASSALSTDRADLSVAAVLTLTLAPGDAPDPAAPADEAGEADTEPLAPTTRTGEGAADAAGGVESTAVAVELEYQVGGAAWAPVYQLRLDGRSGAGTLVLRACVAQRTGEDWTGVRLGLSTADLLRSPGLPELRALRIDRSQQGPEASSWREPPAGLKELFAGYDAATVSRPPALPAPRFGGRSTGSAPVPPPLEPGSAPPAPGGAPLEERFRHTAVPLAAPIPMASSVLGPGEPSPRRAMHKRMIAASDSAPLTDAAPAPPALAADLLDYARLTMTGPDAAEGRGTLRPGSTGLPPFVGEYRRLADTVARLPRPAHVVDVRASAGSFDYRFDTAAPVDVGADGHWHTVPVGEVRVSTEFEYVCVPSVDPSVFGTVLVTNSSRHALLAGPVDVLIDGDFVLTAALPTLAPGQRQAVGVGVAESVKAARRTHMRESTAGLRGGTTVLDHTVEVELANRLPYPVLVEVRERVPVSADKDVRIEEHAARPPWAEPGQPLDGQEDTYVRGARIWRVALEPGRTTTLTGGFDVRFPVGKAAVGGNRRN
ncbi:DUF4139 domain-containing protein [Streptomyces polygonati]|uniref:DUF4139 domain-containing protein n=1 Tax=Streptomyces polygonati TaxID=1617087 RepID=A0ABV8HSP8_9ACTN